MASILWFRRDLRLADNPALVEAHAAGKGTVVPLFVIDPVLWQAAGPARRAYLRASLQALDASIGGTLLVRQGDPRDVLPDLAAATKAKSVHIASDFGPYGSARDDAVADALGSTPLVRSGSPYAVAPGRVAKDDGTPYRVFTPFYRAWRAHGWRAPAASSSLDVDWWRPVEGDLIPEASPIDGLPPAGEAAAWVRWKRFRDGALAAYAEQRNRPDVDGTSALSHHLRFGEIHPRSLLAELSERDEVFRKELCWREFYADVLHNNPSSTRESLDSRYDSLMPWATGAEADELFEAWRSGSTGYPFVDAGMRQLRLTGWMHNRVRMVVASFLVKDLHIPWQRGAAEFMTWLVDGDLASNVHGWQWTAGCGTDAAPFYRVFNPVLQGVKFDPDGDYVRRFVPELAHLPGAAVHEPWKHADGYAGGYPLPVVEHSAERERALADFARLKQVR